MKLLINYIPEEKKYLGSLQYVLRQHGHEGISVSKTLTPSEASMLAKKFDCQAIILINTSSLLNFVDDAKATLTNWRGSRIPGEVPAFVLDSLPNLYSTNEGKFLLDRDLEKVKYSRVPVKKFKFSVLRKVTQFPDWIEKATRALAIGADIETNQWSRKVKTKKIPIFDPETLGVEGLGETWITCVAFTLLMPNGSLETCLLPLVNGMNDYWELDAEYKLAIEFLREMMDTPAPKCFHNGSYDMFHLIRYGAYPRNFCLDTMGLSWSWYSELPKSLDFLASWLLYDAYYWKYLADKDHKIVGTVEDYWKYCALDTWQMMRCMVKLLQTGASWMVPNYAKQFPMVYPFTYGAFEGILLDNTVRTRLLEEATVRVDKQKAVLRTMTDNPDFNPSSAHQNSHFIYEVMGAARPPRAKSATASGKKERSFVAQQHPWIALFVDHVNKYAVDAKAISTYFQFLQWHSRLMYSVDPFGTETGRAASRGSAAWIGTQIQNQPYYAKEMYVPDPGYIGFEIDFSKAEAICTAYLSQCIKLIKALCDPDLTPDGKPKDFYKVLGELFFKMPYEQVTEDFRNKVLKKIQHGTNYMMGAATFMDNLEDMSVIFFAAGVLGLVISATPDKNNLNEMTAVAFCNRLLESYHVPFPEVKQWWAEIRNEVAATSMLVNPHGQTRYFFGDITKQHNIQRGAVAHLPQSTSVGCLNKGYLKAYEYAAALPDKSALRLKTQIHDSILGQVKIELARTIIPELAELITGRLLVHGREMIIPVEVEVFHENWKAKKKWKDFLETTLPTLEGQNRLTLTIAG